MCTVDITLMPGTTDTTRPHSYAELPQSTGASKTITDPASTARPEFADLHVRHAKPGGFVSQACPGDAPRGIVGRFGKRGFGKFRAGDIAHGNQCGTLHNLCCGLVCPVFATVGDFCVYCLDALRLSGSLCHRQGIFMRAREIISGERLRQMCTGNLVSESQVNTDLRIPNRHTRVFNLTLEVDVPPTSGILRKATSLHYSLNRTREPKAETSLQIFDRVALDLQKPCLKRYPSKRVFATAPLQPALLKLDASCDVLPAYLADGIGVQTQLHARASAQVDQFKYRQPVLVSAQYQHGDFITKVPHGIHGPAKSDQMLAACAVFDPVLKGQHTNWHGGSLALRCTSLSCQQRHVQQSRNNKMAPKADQSACVYGAVDTSSGAGERRYL